MYTARNKIIYFNNIITKFIGKRREKNTLEYKYYFKKIGKP